MSIDSGVPHPARRYNYWLGGTDNFPADRESGDRLAAAYPAARIAARANRAFLGRAVGYLAREAGLRQFLDIGTGLPSAGNTHEIAAGSRVVYVDNDPMVSEHARRLLAGSPGIQYLEQDLRRPAQILRSLEVLDLSRPVGLILVAVIHFLRSFEEARSVVATLRSALAPGSYLVMSCATPEFLTPELRAAWAESARTGRSDVFPLDRTDFASFFDGLDLVDPGIVAVGEWQPDPAATEHPAAVDASLFGAVGRVPLTGR